MVAIMLLLYVVQMDTLFAPSGPSAPAEIQQRPWAYEHLLVPAEKTVKKPKAPRPLLTEDFVIAGPAEREGQPRGQVGVMFGTDGRIQADWQADFDAGGKRHQFSSPQIAGNISVKMAYEDQNGRDKTRLFFIAKGPYEHVTTVEGTEQTSREKGTAWVTGWLRPDRSADGFVTITTDQAWSMEFAFNAAAAGD
jgi:hypothetical protein